MDGPLAQITEKSYPRGAVLGASPRRERKGLAGVLRLLGTAHRLLKVPGLVKTAVALEVAGLRVVQTCLQVS